MRYVALFLLLLLSLYFLFLKPLLSSKGVYYDIDRVSLSFEPFSFKVGKAYFYTPISGSYIFIAVEGLKIELGEPIRIELSEGAFTLIMGDRKEDKEEKKTQLAQQPPIPQFLKNLRLRVGKFFITLQGKGNSFVVIENLELRDRKLSTSIDITAGNENINIEVQEVRLLEKQVDISSVTVDSQRFRFKLSGKMEEEELRARFDIEGTIREIDTNALRVSPINIKGKGYADYGGLRADLRASTKEIDIKGRKIFKYIRATGKLRANMEGVIVLEGQAHNREILLDYRTEFGKRNLLLLDIKSFPIDSGLLGLGEPFFAWVKGNLKVDFDRKELRAYGRTEGINTNLIPVGSSEVDFTYDYGRGEGSFEAVVHSPMSFSMHGEFNHSSFKGIMQLKDLLFVGYGFSGFVSYRGSVSYEKSLHVKGKGTLENFYLRDVALGDFYYGVSFGENLDITYGGNGIKGYLRGTPESGFISISDIKGYALNYRGTELKLEDTSVEVFLKGNRLTLSVELKKGSLKGANFSFPLKGSFSLRRGKKLTGSLSLMVEEGSVGSLELKGVHLHGELDDLEVRGEYGAQGLVEGIYTLNLKSLFISTSGVVVRENLSLNYSFEGTPEGGKVKLLAQLKLRDSVQRLRAEVSYNKNRLSARLFPQTFKEGSFELNFGGLSMEGSLREGSIRFYKSSLRILGEPVVELYQEEEGYYNLENMEFRARLLSRGSVRGEAYFDYRKDKGIELLSQGQIDLRALSFFTTTPLGGRAEGFLVYRISYNGNEGLSLDLKNGGKIVTRSLYFTFPMESWIELKALQKSLSAFITLWKGDSGLSANLGSTNLRDFYLYIVSRDMPLSYRGKGFSLNMGVSSEGWVNVRNLKKVSLRIDALLSGEVNIEKIGGKAEDKGRKKEKEEGAEVELDINFDTSSPIRVNLPEGYVYVKVMGWVGGTAEEPQYGIKIEFLSGELTYFGRKFFLRGGTLSFLKEEETQESNIDISLVNPSQELTIFINLRGELSDPDIVVWSEPPRNAQEILTKLIIGSTAEGIIPVAKALFKQLGYLGNIRSGLSSLLGVEINLSTQTGSQGEIGVNVNIRKQIAKALAIEYQQSTLKDPRATYYGGSIKLPGGTSFYGRVFSDNTSEIKLRFIRKFDF